jgi:hypothetical protein
MNNKKTIGLIIGFVILAGISFYAGNMYASVKNKNQATQVGNDFAMRPLTGGQRGMRAGGGNVFGKIIALDANSITVELGTPGGPNANNTTGTATGSKIVLYTNATNILKTSVGTIADLAIGKQVSIQGTANPDGSVSATSVQIR